LKIGTLDFQHAHRFMKEEGRPLTDEGQQRGWYGGSYSDCLELLVKGDPAALRKAKDLEREVQDLDFSSLERKFQPNVVGSSVSVPCYLQGRPKCFRRLEPQPGLGPVRVFYNFDASCGFSDDQLARRSYAAAALALAISRVRPVELYGWFANNYGYSARYEGLLMIRMGVSPFDRARIGALCNSMFLRRLGFAALRRVWGWKRIEKYGIASPRRSSEFYLQPEPQDVVIPRAHSAYSDEILKDPAAWLRRWDG
jgi:hypothetical protein